VGGKDARRLLELFPAARTLSGYGNTLLGMSPQTEDRSLERPRYFPHGARLLLRLVEARDTSPELVPAEVPAGEPGRVLATRLDPSFLIVNLLERDRGVATPPPPDGGARGFHSPGILAPEPLPTVPAARLGIY
jgi:hypothetical protein